MEQPIDKIICSASSGQYAKMLKEAYLMERFAYKTALNARHSVVKFAQKLLDSSAIESMSNFKSYEDKDTIKLKVGIFKNKNMSLKKVRETYIDRLKLEGWEETVSESGDCCSYCKDNITIKFHPIQKVFRSGPYKNREVPQMGIEISGPKKFQKIQ